MNASSAEARRRVATSNAETASSQRAPAAWNAAAAADFASRAVASGFAGYSAAFVDPRAVTGCGLAIKELGPSHRLLVYD